MEHNEIGKSIAYYRKLRNMTQQQLADELDVIRNVITRYETGENDPSLDFVVKLAKFFDTTTDDLLGYELVNPEKKPR